MAAVVYEYLDYDIDAFLAGVKSRLSAGNKRLHNISRTRRGFFSGYVYSLQYTIISAVPPPPPPPPLPVPQPTLSFDIGPIRERPRPSMEIMVGPIRERAMPSMDIMVGPISERPMPSLEICVGPVTERVS
jgi:hypothetical protein